MKNIFRYRDSLYKGKTVIRLFYHHRHAILILEGPCYTNTETWWRHQMETFSTLLALCAGNSPVTGEFPAQRPVTLSFDVFFDLCLNKRLSKQSWGWWFETTSPPLWRHRNDVLASQLSGHCDVFSNSLWCQQNVNWSSEILGQCVKFIVFIIIYGFVMSCKK